MTFYETNVVYIFKYNIIKFLHLLLLFRFKQERL